MAAALAVLAQLTGTSGYWLLAAGLIPLGAGMGPAMTPATSNITSALPASQQGVASALNDLSREVGGAVGIAVLASILTAAYQSNLHLAHLPAAQAGSARSSVAVATRLGPAAAAQAHTAFADGMHLAAGIVFAAALTVGRLLPAGPGSCLEQQAGDTNQRMRLTSVPAPSCVHAPEGPAMARRGCGASLLPDRHPVYSPAAWHCQWLLA
jgi:hypothetical protein